MVPTIVLYKCNPIAVLAPDAQMSWWHFTIVEETLRLHHGLWELVLFMVMLFARLILS